VTLTGTNFIAGARVLVGNENVTVTNVAVAGTTHITATFAIAGNAAPGPAAVSVSTGAGTSGPATFIVAAVPSVYLMAPASTRVPTDPARVSVELSAPAAAAMTGTLSLSCRPNAAAVNSTYCDPAMQFASGGKALDFTVPAGSTFGSMLQAGALQQGTVAGEIIVTLTALELNGTSMLPPSPPTRTIQISRMAPVITNGSVRLVDITDAGFAVVLTGYSTPRDLSAVSFTFSPAAGAELSAGTTVTVPIGPEAAVWFDSDAGRANGSRFALRIPLALYGDSRALGGVTVKLSNSAGDSALVSGGR
jgi:hypothetical protein